jgi:hypothetical protein
MCPTVTPLLHEQHIRPVGTGTKFPVCVLNIFNVRTEPATALARVKRAPIHADTTAIRFKLFVEVRAHTCKHSSTSSLRDAVK